MSKDSSQSRIYCGGKFITGPDKTYFYLTLVLTYAPHIPLYALICPYFEDKMSAVVYVIPAYLLIAGTMFLLLAALSDPGIVTRGKPIVEADNPFSVETKTPVIRKCAVNGVEIDTKWCDTCNIYRPVRTSHCGVCNNCVENFDHHCPWLGNCVGRRNYRYYLLYIFTTTLDGLFIMTLSIAHIIMNTNDSSKSSHGDRVKDALADSYYFGIILPVYTLAALGFVGGLSGFHCYLVGHGISTNEFIKKSFRNRKNPFNHGCLWNFIHALCPPMRPPLFLMNYRRNLANQNSELMIHTPSGVTAV